MKHLQNISKTKNGEFENDDENYDAAMPVSPMAHYLNSSALNVFVLCVLEIEIPIDDSKAMQLLEGSLLPLNPRFSSIMIEGKKGKKQWKPVEVNLKEHIKVPIFPRSNNPAKLYDDDFDEYLTKIAGQELPQDKPLWEVHIIKYPTRNSKGALVFKMHHALGDGYTLMASLLSCVQRADDPSIPITFPSSKKSAELDDDDNSNIKMKSMLKKLPQIIFSVIKGASDFGWSVLKGNLLVDHESPIKSGHEDVGSRPIAISTVCLSVDSIKEVKNKLEVSTNDVLVGMIFLSIRLYMIAKNAESSKAEATGLVLLNTRRLRAYKSVKEMLDTKTNSGASWGNQIQYMHLPIPKSNDNSNSLNPLEFVLSAHKIINSLRNSLAIPLNGVLLGLIDKIKGPEAAAKYIYKALANSSLSISNVVGPVEKVAIDNHPVKGIYCMSIGTRQSLTVTILSYMGYFHIGFGVEKDWIDVHHLISCFETAQEMILNAANKI
ncbi:wax ester synthase/diacylglycerol acyltransferase 2-like [Arachis duranensis]|uniref:Wax ester synthase/diacylglycerol acyltransferase 2-like n=1 Tax=Arachis duranensis TaxID=130453 RepID=A0A6P5MKM3_ARADU|nr:wax ester synthase/diacylglycerol acyltransferase 2-like [Arachis duranensis]XP_020985015.1 wax ester synthase/diacylglycerol acyltransferase 2-like [Arachis duranensis]